MIILQWLEWPSKERLPLKACDAPVNQHTSSNSARMNGGISECPPFTDRRYTPRIICP